MSELLSAIERHARSRPRDAALIGYQHRLNYGELPSQIEERARHLQSRGCRTIGLQIDNGPDWVLWDLAAISSGTVCVPLPALFSADQQRHAIAAAGIDHLITAGGISAVDTVNAVEVPPSTAKITFTSGSTGSPKGVCLAQPGLERVALSIVDAVDVRHRRMRRHLSVLPLGILLENIAGVFAALFAGSSIQLPGLGRIGFETPFQPDFSRLLRFMKDNAIQSAIVVPELLRGLTMQQRHAPVALPELQFIAVGGAKIAPELIRRARDLGLPAYEGYGLSECGSVISLNTEMHDRPGSAGKLLPHIEASHRHGEIVIDNPVFLGYLGEPHSGPLATGDRGYIDGDGFIHLQGRLRNVIITSFGRNISPEWVESVLVDQAEIAQAIVYGEAMPQPRALVTVTDAAADIPAAIARANRGLPEYARIADFQVVPPFTAQNGLLTATGRPRRDAILAAHQSVISEESQHGFLRSAGL